MLGTGLLANVLILDGPSKCVGACFPKAGSSCIRHTPVQAWLGLADVDPAALWMLLLAYGASVLLVHADDWERCAGQQRPQRAQQAVGEEQAAEGQISRASSFDGIECPTPLLARSLEPSVALEGREAGEPARQHTTLHVSASEPLLGPAGAQAPGADSAPGLWQPLTLEAQPQWQWHDRLRYAFFRFFLDALLVCVVALCECPEGAVGRQGLAQGCCLCFAASTAQPPRFTRLPCRAATLEVDALHLCYLALVLWLFRNRIALRYQRNK